MEDFDAGIWSSLVQEVIVKTKDDIRFIFKNGFEVRVQKQDLMALRQKCLGVIFLWQKHNSYYDRILCCMSESKCSQKFEFSYLSTQVLDSIIKFLSDKYFT